MAKAVFIFYGFSGDGGKTPKFPDGVDKDKSFKIVAETLAVILKNLFPEDSVHIIQAWTKDKILDALEDATETIRQVHIACHGDSTWLSCAYYFDHGKRLSARARRFNAMAKPDDERAKEALLAEDAIAAGLFSRALDKKRIAKIKGNHAGDASWQIWGCYAGYEKLSFSGIGDPEVDPYLKRFNFGLPQIDGVAVDIAKALGVTVTAAIDGSGLEFWHGDRKKHVIKNDRKVAARLPFWLWNTKGSKWLSYDKNGKALPKPEIFQVPRDAKDLPTPKPPKWLTDLFWKSSP